MNKAATVCFLALMTLVNGHPFPFDLKGYIVEKTSKRKGFYWEVKCSLV